mmetsp:Transcript_7245/g.10714  ORF Transcript_7245/g.10714 Transcript_7245/m.10714 type:complete len:213 (+) Transcript_7245:406-1044(+)
MKNCNAIIKNICPTPASIPCKNVLQNTVYIINNKQHSCAVLKYFLYCFTNSFAGGTKCCKICPIKIGNTTLSPNLKNTCPMLTSPLTPRYPRIKAGLRNIPTRLPNAALNIAEASSPPALLVNTSTMLIVMGSDAQMVIPSARLCVNAFTLTMSLENPNTILLTTPKLNSCTNRLNGNRWKALANSSVLIPIPARMNMNITAIQVAVICGAR